MDGKIRKSLHNRIDMNKSFNKLSEQEILKEVRQVVPNYLAQARNTGVFDFTACFDLQVAELRRLYRQAYDRSGLDAFTAHFRPLIKQQTEEIQLKFNKRRTLMQVEAATARGILLPAFDQAGLKADIVCQRYRAKVTVRLTARQYLIFYVSYKSLREEQARQKLIRAVLDMQDAANRIGGILKFAK